MFINILSKYRDIRKQYNEINDCTVVAFAEVFNTSYEKAHRHLKLHCGRVSRKGIVSLNYLVR